MSGKQGKNKSKTRCSEDGPSTTSRNLDGIRWKWSSRRKWKSRTFCLFSFSRTFYLFVFFPIRLFFYVFCLFCCLFCSFWFREIRSLSNSALGLRTVFFVVMCFFTLCGIRKFQIFTKNRRKQFYQTLRRKLYLSTKNKFIGFQNFFLFWKFGFKRYFETRKGSGHSSYVGGDFYSFWGLFSFWFSSEISRNFTETSSCWTSAPWETRGRSCVYRPCLRLAGLACLLHQRGGAGAEH